jgi:hypothetical protein
LREIFEKYLDWFWWWTRKQASLFVREEFDGSK